MPDKDEKPVIVHGLNRKDAYAYYKSTVLGTGGEGTAYPVYSGTSDLVVKIYKSPTPKLEKKLIYMVSNPAPNVTDQYGNFIMTLAWPIDVVYDSAGQFTGYVMPRLKDSVEIFEIERGCTSERAKAMFPNYSWRLNVLVARNLAASVMALHCREYNYVIGDMNTKNIFVNPDGSISILDTDSFDLTNRLGIEYKCGVGTPEYLPPELQGKDLPSDRARFNAQTDDFALAIHIFRLLMNNRHPFTCLQLVAPQNSLPQNTANQNVAQGKCPYIRQIPGFGIPLGAPTMEDILPDYIRRDFIQTFDYSDSTAIARIPCRTTAAKWLEDLKRLLQDCDNGLIRCNQAPAHFYLQSKGQCGWCAALKRKPIPIPPTPTPVPPTPQPDRYFYNHRYFVTEQEARTGGMIAVYKGKGKEHHPLPPYADIERWDNDQYLTSPLRNQKVFFLHGSRLDTYKLTEYSDGCLQQASRDFNWTIMEDLIEAVFVSVFQVVFWVIIAQIGFQIVDWILEMGFDYDLLEGYSLHRFGLILRFSPFAFYGGKFRMVPVKGYWDWSPYVIMLLNFLFDKMDVDVSFSNRKKIQEEIERRRKL